MYVHPDILVIDNRKIHELIQKGELSEAYCNSIPIVHMLVYETDLPKCFLLPDAGENNPYHIFFYMIARFYFLDDGRQHIPFYYPKREGYLIEQALNHLPPRFQRTTIQLEDVEYIQPPSCYWLKDCIQEDWIYSYVKHLYTPLWSSIQASGKRVFLTRQTVERRKLLQEKELLQPLKERGFSFYELEWMTFEDQIQLFASASIVIGVHGAGLTWSLFCKEGTKLCELGFEARQHYSHIASHCKFQYFPYTETICDAQENMSLDPTHFLQYLDTMVLEI